MTEKKYTKDHEWVSINENIAIVGISNHAQESLGDIVFVELPELGKEVSSGDQISVIESVKAASDIYSPVSGKILEINDNLSNDASIINKDAENEGWIFKIELSDSNDLSNLMTFEQYKEFLDKK
tara:strand:- start:964 stop:1338 length:375 start_codon:yes stop_codon:yes gene_type:complete